MHMNNVNNKTVKIVPAFEDGKLFAPNALEGWPEFEIRFDCPKALFDGAEGLRRKLLTVN